MPEDKGLLEKIKSVLIGGTRNPKDRRVFHSLSLAAFFAWVGLGADGLSSSCYGPQEAFKVLEGHTSLALFVALATAFTILVISAGYVQIVETFPTGGGGYLVASKLLSPTVGMVSGCALLIDYVLTIAVSIAAGTDALFSFLPPHWRSYKLAFSIVGVLVLTLMNLRGVRESVRPLVPIFLLFLLTHAFAIVYAFFVHVPGPAELMQRTAADLSAAKANLGLLGMATVILHAYSMGAGTFTGIEAVSNGLPILREPRVQTAKTTMRYMAFSLVFTAGGLMVAYFLHSTQSTADKTSNAVLMETITSGWGAGGRTLVLVTLLCEAAILVVAAQTGFIGGPRVMANMAMDRWFPTRFALLSDRLVTGYGVAMMGLAALAMILLFGGRLEILVVLYSINVFITFVLSQLGMVRHWWAARAQAPLWKRKISINGLGLLLSAFILVTMIVLKFHDGGWITLVVTTGLVLLCLMIRRHYKQTFEMLKRLDALVPAVEADTPEGPPATPTAVPGGNTAAILVNGFNGLGLHSLLAVIQLFGKAFDNYAFVQVGAIDAGNFKGVRDVHMLGVHVDREVQRYVSYMARHGLYAEGFTSVGVDVVDEVVTIADQIRQKYPNVVFFAGQLVFARDSLVNRLLHNHVVFAAQRRLYMEGVPFVVLPVRV